jgi:hypothetical protein
MDSDTKNNLLNALSPQGVLGLTMPPTQDYPLPSYEPRFVGPGKGLSGALGQALFPDKSKTFGQQLLKGLGYVLTEPLDVVAEGVEIPAQALKNIYNLPPIPFGSDYPESTKIDLSGRPEYKGGGIEEQLEAETDADTDIENITDAIVNLEKPSKETPVGPNFEGLEGPDKTKKEPDQNVNKTAIDDALKSALDSFSTDETDEKTIEDYKNEFYKATGLSDKPDMKQAALAFGLALMQNKAGKGFNVAKMLSETGKAGEAALPAIEKAIANAKISQAKAGEYAIRQTQADETERKAIQKEMMNRSNYLVIPREGLKGGPVGIAEAIVQGKGKIIPFNLYELNEFTEKNRDDFVIVQPEDYAEMTAELLKPPEIKDKYLTTVQDLTLFPQSDFKHDYRVPVNPESGDKPILVGESGALAEIDSRRGQLQSTINMFQKIANVMTEVKGSGLEVPDQVGSAIIQLSRNLGVPLSEDPSPIKRLNVFLQRLSAQQAAAILGEKGKTLSDSDRELVKDIVGNVTYTEADIAILEEKMNALYTKIIGEKTREVQQALTTISGFSNPKVQNYLVSSGFYNTKQEGSEEEATIISEANKVLGI